MRAISSLEEQCYLIAGEEDEKTIPKVPTEEVDWEFEGSFTAVEREYTGMRRKLCVVLDACRVEQMVLLEPVFGITDLD